MIKYLFPKAYIKYLSLPVLGPILNNFSKFLFTIGYPYPVIRVHLRTTKIIDFRLRKRKCKSVKMITRSILQSCAPAPGHSQEDIESSATVKLLERYFDKIGILPSKKLLSPIENMIIEYQSYLQKVRGFAPSTAHHHCVTVSQFLNQYNRRGGLSYLLKLAPQDIENFVHDTGSRLNRGSLQHAVGHLRAFLHFLVTRGEVPVGLNIQIDTPRIYREEQLPRSLDWKTVCTLLKSIDRTTAIGKRDYAMLLLITTYGLRASEIVALKLEDIEWRKNRLRIFQLKNTTPLLLPLMDSIGESIIDYLRHGRPPTVFREIFVRHRAPSGILKPTAINEVFQYWTRRSGLNISFYGTHCLRHSYAVHLLRQGTPLKTIGDLLGHRNFESTCVYLRLNIEDLRTVPLPLPTSSISIKGE